jgi:probable HAF family extracellular repeat protein
MPIPPLPGADESWVRGISGDGRVVVGDSGPVNGCCSHAIRWTAALGTQDLGTIPLLPYAFPQYSALAANNDGTVIVGAAGDGGGQARSFRWTMDGGIVDLDITTSASDASSAKGVSGTGLTIVGRAQDEGGFRWENGVVTFSWPTGAVAISRDGSTVLTATYDGMFTHTIRWTQAGAQDIGNFSATALSTDGSTVVGATEDFYPGNGVRWTAAGGLVNLPRWGPYSGPDAVAGDGVVSVGSGEMHDGACLWIGNSAPIDLPAFLSAHGADLTGWTLLGASAISEDGTVLAGDGYFGGLQLGWVAFLVPQCASPDFNHDGDIATDADIEAFFACLGGACCPTCDSADVNGDGDIGTDADIESFFRIIAGQPC